MEYQWWLCYKSEKIYIAEEVIAKFMETNPLEIQEVVEHLAGFYRLMSQYTKATNLLRLYLNIFKRKK